MEKKYDLSLFSGFVKKNTVEQNITKEVWCYTRVSTIDQKSNYSLKNQQNDAEIYANANNYKLVKTFGGTYESGKDDFTRKEFSRLIDEVKKAKIKPYAIIIYKMNRFSRSGGSGITLADMLVKELGVHLIETVSGIDTTTDKGLLEIQKKLINAREENITRLEHTLPGLKAFLRAGNWLGTAPLGYEHCGTRVRDFNKRSVEQTIRLDENGKKMKLAWQWKLEGDTDAEIIRKLLRIGVKMTPQRISAMWRNIFYCGLISNRMLDGEIIFGRHEQMVSKEVFLKVNDIVSVINKSGYTIVKDVEERPLTNHLYCSECGNKMTSYENKKKHIHYYKCQKCNGASINANTPATRSKNVGAHDLFIQQLSTFQMDEIFSDIYKLQIKKILGNITNEKKNEGNLVKKQLTELKNKKEKLEERHAYGEINDDMYSKYYAKITAEIAELMSNNVIDEKSISNLQSKVEKSIDFTRNIQKYWLLGSVDKKKRIQKLVFPDGLILDARNRQYLTSKTNKLFTLNHSLSNEYGIKEKGLITNKSDKSSTVARPRIELGTS